MSGNKTNHPLDIANYIKCPICNRLFHLKSRGKGFSRKLNFNTCSRKCNHIYHQKYHPWKGRLSTGITYKEKICENCNILFRFETKGEKHDDRKRFCSRKCLYKFLAKQKGDRCIKWEGGKPKCIDCGKITSSYSCKRCNECHRKEMVGKNHPSWQGGITPEKLKIRNSNQSLEWRKNVFRRDNYTCQNCGQRGGDLEADHIKEFSKYPELRFALDNGRTLCVSCHKKRHARHV
jgi:5-methylcytosine-specific restriction endonuclease McrA